MPTFIPAYPQAMPMQYAPPRQAPPAFARPTTPYAAQPAPAPASTFRPATAPTVRAQDSAEGPLLQLPSPEQLGLTSAAPASAVVPAPGSRVDWTSVHQRLDQLGATGFNVEKIAGGCRVSCLLPAGQADRSHRIDAQANSEVDAVRLALSQAEAWARGGR